MQIKNYIQDNKLCPYLLDRESITYYKIIKDCTIDKYYQLLQIGYRRFGVSFFTPICNGCFECQTIRVLVEEFSVTKSQKRVLRKNNDIKIIIQKPILSIEHINLHNRYHEFMTQKKGWDVNYLDEEEYYYTYVDGANNFGYEMILLKDNKLVGVGLFDVLNDSISSVYHFYEPTMQKNSLGKFLIISQILIAKNNNFKYWYPGYWIKNHYSMGYKEKFKPFEVLLNRVNNPKDCIWKRY